MLTVQKELILTTVSTSVLTQCENNIDGVLNSGTFEKCAEFQDEKSS